MASPSMLWMRVTDTAPAVYDISGIDTPGAGNQVGNTFGTLDGLVNSQNKPLNRVIQYEGELFAMAADGIYQKNDPTSMSGDWTIQLTFTTPHTSYSSYSGLYPILIDGTPGLVGVYKDSNAAENYWRWVKYDGTSWTQASSATAILVYGQKVVDAIVYQNKLYALWEQFGATYCMAFDPTLEIFHEISRNVYIGATNVPISYGRESMAIYDDGLYLAYRLTAPNYHDILCKLEGNNWVYHSLIKNIGAGGAGLFGGDAMYCLFVDTTSATYPILVALMPNVSGTGWICAYTDSSDYGATWTEITSTVLPAGLQSGLNSLSTRFFVVYDTNSNPGTTDTYLYYSASGTSGVLTEYSWNGIGSVITSNGTGSNTQFAVPRGYPNTGERTWSTTELDVKITSIDDETVSFKAYGGGTGRTFTLYYSTEGEPDLFQATLTTPVTGGSASLSGNSVTGIAADGSTTYTVAWNLSADGITQGARTNAIPRIEA